MTDMAFWNGSIPDIVMSKIDPSWPVFRPVLGFEKRKSSNMRIIGLDPGLRYLGWGVVESKNGRLTHVDHGVILSGNGDLSVRLARLFEGLGAVLDRLDPVEAAVEETFVNANPTSTLKLGQARAVCLLAPGLRSIAVAEYAPNKVKKALVGKGLADKTQVAHMVSMLLPGIAIQASDASDALALAICHAHHRGPDRLRAVS